MEMVYFIIVKAIKNYASYFIVRSFRLLKTLTDLLRLIFSVRKWRVIFLKPFFLGKFPEFSFPGCFLCWRLLLSTQSSHSTLISFKWLVHNWNWRRNKMRPWCKIGGWKFSRRWPWRFLGSYGCSWWLLLWKRLICCRLPRAAGVNSKWTCATCLCDVTHACCSLEI